VFLRTATTCAHALESAGPVGRDQDILGPEDEFIAIENEANGRRLDGLESCAAHFLGLN
jgi:hypothetical protein